MHCPFSEKLSLFHDGELDSAAHAETERHLASCGECAAELAGIREMSRLMFENPAPRLSQMGLHRIHRRTDLLLQAPVLRMARTLRAIAACVLIAGSGWLVFAPAAPSPAQPESPAETGDMQAPPPWLDVAATVTAESGQMEATSPAAAWYLADVSGNSDDTQ
jgi:anti-sigma factor RsiW